MANPWTIAPHLDVGALRSAHDTVVGERSAVRGIRPLVYESWQRSLDQRIDPDQVLSRVDLGDEQLREYRSSHPLSLALPTIHRLLVRHAFDSGLIVAVGDHTGRLLWIDGDRDLRRRAEGMLFVEGADWSEQQVGTSAPGTALALDHGIQITRAEHFTRVVHPWSCTAVPVHDPATGQILGVIDITGGDEAVAPATLPLLEAAVAAVETELRIQSLESPARPARRGRPTVARPLLQVLGRDEGELAFARETQSLSLRHAEILTLLAWHRGGLTAERLAQLVYGRDDAEVTLRAEMVRLRRALPPEFRPLGRPYRLPVPIELDAQGVLGFLERGAHKVALGSYPGAVLPRSAAPGVVEIRDELATALREALLTGGSVDTLLEYARSDDAAFDREVWAACLRLLPPRSPKRAAVVSRLERIDAEVGATRMQPPTT
ncbi:MAG: GAF domain-containing protein [Microbacteriaceae bacterium]